MKIIPLGKQIQLKIDEPKAGMLDTSSRQVMMEDGRILALGEEVTIKAKVGDKVLFKAWAVDMAKVNDKMYYFIHQDSAGLLAIMEEPLQVYDGEN